jgi:hypothetical protein
MHKASNGLVVGAITPHSGLSGKARPEVLVLKAIEWRGGWCCR